MDVCTITSEQARPLRHAVLRAESPWEESFYPGDDDEGTVHLGLYDGSTLIATASVFHEAPANTVDAGAWRLRGMAVHPAYRSQGYGTRVLTRAVAHAREFGGTHLWCNARVAARVFYERAGFCVQSDAFDAPPSGLHFYMIMHF